MEGATLRFVGLARALTQAGRAASVQVPAFRSPPRVPGALRSLRRLPSGPVVAVALRGRPISDVAKDMIDGILVVNELDARSAKRIRQLLEKCVAAELSGSPSTREAA